MNKRPRTSYRRRACHHNWSGRNPCRALKRTTKLVTIVYESSFLFYPRESLPSPVVAVIGPVVVVAVHAEEAVLHEAVLPGTVGDYALGAGQASNAKGCGSKDCCKSHCRVGSERLVIEFFLALLSLVSISPEMRKTKLQKSSLERVQKLARKRHRRLLDKFECKRKD